MKNLQAIVVRLKSLLLAAFISLALFGCAVRKSVPVGVVPAQGEVSAEEEQYGHEVFGALSERYQLDRDDARINRVRDIVDRLTAGAKADGNPWHVHVFVDDRFKNAAATRGNYIFVWTGMLHAVQNDSELATILSHEIAHSLAGHTMPDPTEELGRILADAAGQVSSGVLSSQTGLPGIAISLSQVLIQAGIEAIVVNPNTQAKEYEADQIGLFVMADAGYNPELGVNFWERVKDDPEFGASSMSFLSTHPSSADRVDHLRQVLPEALQRYERRRRGVTVKSQENKKKSSAPPVKQPTASKQRALPADEDVPPASLVPQAWVVMAAKTKVLARPNSSSRVVGHLKPNTEIYGDAAGRDWLSIYRPIIGYVSTADLKRSQK